MLPDTVLLCREVVAWGRSFEGLLPWFGGDLRALLWRRWLFAVFVLGEKCATISTVIIIYCVHINGVIEPRASWGWGEWIHWRPLLDSWKVSQSVSSPPSVSCSDGLSYDGGVVTHKMQAFGGNSRNFLMGGHLEVWLFGQECAREVTIWLGFGYFIDYWYWSCSWPETWSRDCRCCAAASDAIKLVVLTQTGAYASGLTKCLCIVLGI